MSQKTEGWNRSITRRSALKAGAVAASTLTVGGAAIGTAGASEAITTRAFPIDFAVRAADDSDPGSPKPDPKDLLVERSMGNPIDDGTDVDEVDGTHQLRWGEFSAVQGKAEIECVEGGTHVDMKLTGLVPGALYTGWVVVFKPPGFIDTRDLGGTFGLRALDNLIGLGSLGAPDGSQNAFRVTGSTGMLDVVHPDGELSVFGSVDDCLLNEYEVRFHVIIHLDDASHGPVPGPTGSAAAQVGFKFGTSV